MRKLASFFLLALTSSSLLACAATVGAINVPKDAQATCAGMCSDIGMTLNSVVVMAGNVGCVCDPRGGAPAPGAKASVSGGIAAILIAEGQQRQQQMQQQQHKFH